MKICPTCRKTYADDNLNFCLEDGSILTMSANDPPPTVMMSQPRPTDPSPAMTTHQPYQPAIQSSYGNQPHYSAQPKKSKAWLWIVGIVGILLLLCGGGFGLLVFIGMQADRKSNNNSVIASNTNRGPIFSNSNSTTTPPTPPPTSGSVDSIDLSNFVQTVTIYGTTEMVGDELLMAARQKRYYYVLVAPDDYTTDDSTTQVTVRNVDNADSSLGYGLIFHSDPKPLTKDYAFLIDAKRKRYRVVRHDTTSETSVIPWKNSTAIKDGTQENVLEVRDKGSMIELYINGQMATSIADEHGQPNGVPGLYSGDGVKVGFKKLEIRK